MSSVLDRMSRLERIGPGALALERRPREDRALRHVRLYPRRRRQPAARRASAEALRLRVPPVLGSEDDVSSGASESRRRRRNKLNDNRATERAKTVSLACGHRHDRVPRRERAGHQPPLVPVPRGLRAAARPADEGRRVIAMSVAASWAVIAVAFATVGGYYLLLRWTFDLLARKTAALAKEGGDA